jgi:phosphatidylglycerophosphate synthase
MPPKTSAVVVEDADDYDYSDEELTSPINQQSNFISPKTNTTNASPDPDRSGLAPAEEGAFDIWLRNNINIPLLSITPEWIDPNHISYANTAACWIAFLLSVLSYRYEHVYPDTVVCMRFIMVILIWSSMVLDCLDGMQARKTNRCSKLGELLDHALDSANIPLCSCTVLCTLMPDQYTILISLIGGVMIYNAQLVIYKHSHVFVLPPVTGPVAQAMSCVAMIAFTIFFRLFDRHAYIPSLIITIFAIIGNITQMQNTYFFTRRLINYQCMMPHIRFSLLMIIHGCMLPMGYFTIPEYMTSAIFLAWRLNGRYVLDTLVGFKPFNQIHTREVIRKEDTTWRIDCIIAIVILFLLGYITGRGSEMGDNSSYGSFLFDIVHYSLMALSVAISVNDLKTNLPALNAK